MLSARKLGVVVFLLPFVAGCLPGVTWLPDATGFFYTGGEDYRQLMFWDATAHKSAVLVKDTGAPTFWPAVSPDGKWIVVAKAEDKAIELVFYDRAGREKNRVRKLAWHPRPMRSLLSDEKMLPALFWSPSGDGILVNAWFDASGIYDVKAETWQSFKGAPMIIGHSPFRPDGKGFLLHGLKGEKEAYFWRNLEGEQTELRDSGKVLKEWLKKTEGNISQNMLLVAPFLCESWWEADRAYSRWGDQRLHLNLRPHSVSIDKVVPNRAKDTKVVHNQFEFPKTRVQVRVVDDNDEEVFGVMLMRVEGQRPRDKNAQVLNPKTATCFLVPSPNKAFVTVCSDGSDQQASRGLVVVHEDGKVVADISAPPKVKKKQDTP